MKNEEIEPSLVREIGREFEDAFFHEIGRF